MRTISSGQLGKYYYSKQSNYGKSLFMDYYFYGKLSEYRKDNRFKLSLYTKIFLCCQIVNGLRVLRD